MGIALCFLPLIAGFLIISFGFKLKFSHQLIAALIGLIAVLPISIIQFFVPSIPFLNDFPIIQTLLKSLFLFGFIEEAFKLLLCSVLPYKNYTTLPFLLLSFIAGLSLGCFESAVYFFDHLQMANLKGAEILYSQILLRIFSSDVIHLTCTGLCGLCMFSIKNQKPRISLFVWAVMLHGLFDFFVGFQNNLRFFAAAVILLAIAECRIKFVTVKELLETGNN